jgi:hypothetical protein
MTYYLYVDGGGNKNVPTYFSYQLYEDAKPAGPIVWREGRFTYTEEIKMNRMLTSKIPQNEIPPGCPLIDKEGNSTNNLAEIMAHYYALKRVYDVSGKMPLTVRQDSKLIINFVNGSWVCKKPWLQCWLNSILYLKWSTVEVEWVSRNEIVKILGH